MGEDKAKQRIANHLNIVMVAGWRILVYDNLECIYLTVELLQRQLKRSEKVYFVRVCVSHPL